MAAQGQAATAGGGAAATAPPRRRLPGGRLGLALVFLGPALLLLGALVLYPIFFTVGRSLFDRGGESFVGLDNYREMFSSPSTLTAIKNNAIWVVFAPSIATALGLIYAVLSERIKWATAFKVIIFMPMAISFLAAGIIFRLVYDDDPRLGLLNASIGGVVDVFRPPGQYSGARPSQPEDLISGGEEGNATSYVTTDPVSPGERITLGMIGIPPRILPEDAADARAPPSAPADGIAGSVWLDFRPGGGGERGAVDAGEQGMPGIRVEAVRDGSVVASATTEPDGTFVIPATGGPATVRLAGSAFRAPFGGYQWLGPTLVTPAVIGAFVWIWAGFAMVLIGAGLAAIPREVLEAARVDGAGEWQVFRRVTVPLLAPVLLVVLVTLVINVLKVFDLVLVIPPGSSQSDANVVALEMWRVSFGGGRDQGLGSALAVFLFLLVVPAMAFNIRRFRSEE